MEKISYYKKYLILASCLVLFVVAGICYFMLNNNDSVITEVLAETTSTTSAVKEESTKLYFDIKGSVKKPGVYEFTQGDKIIDAINKAGGLTKNATTNNLNLSKKLTNEMVIYVFSKNELTTTKAYEQVSNASECKCETIELLFIVLCLFQLGFLNQNLSTVIYACIYDKFNLHICVLLYSKFKPVNLCGQLLMAHARVEDLAFQQLHILAAQCELLASLSHAAAAGDCKRNNPLGSHIITY